MCYLCSMLFNVDKNMQHLLTLLTLLTKLQGCYIYMVLGCIQNCLSLNWQIL